MSYWRLQIRSISKIWSLLIFFACRQRCWLVKPMREMDAMQKSATNAFILSQTQWVAEFWISVNDIWWIHAAKSQWRKIDDFSNNIFENKIFDSWLFTLSYRNIPVKEWIKLQCSIRRRKSSLCFTYLTSVFILLKVEGRKGFSKRLANRPRLKVGYSWVIPIFKVKNQKRNHFRDFQRKSAIIWSF